MNESVYANARGHGVGWVVHGAGWVEHDIRDSRQLHPLAFGLLHERESYSTVDDDAR